MSTWSQTVPRIVDGTPVAAATVNPPLDALTNRTQYLYDQLSGPSRGTLQALNQAVAPGSGVTAGAVVYFDGAGTLPGLRLTSPKLADLADYPFFRGADSAHIFGIVQTVNPAGDQADVWLHGLIRQPGLVTALLDEPDPAFRSGPLYLSNIRPGRLTPQPNGLAILAGFAKNLDEFLLSPNQESLSELFWTFRFNILDRPAGTATQVNRLWAISDVNLDKVGWIPATSRLTQSQLAEMFPDQGVPAYFYNVPAPDVVDSANPELTEAERLAAKSFRAALPARPNAHMFLTVNGVVHSARMHAEDRGIFVLNELGLWWYRDTGWLPPESSLDTGEFEQPWAANWEVPVWAVRTEDTNQDVRPALYLINPENPNDARIFPLNAQPELQVGQPVRFGFSGVLPEPLQPGTAYEVSEVGLDRFHVRLPGTGTSIPLTTRGSGRPELLVGGPLFQETRRPPEFLRPRISLQFTKLNPDVRQSMVTTLRGNPSVPLPALQVLDRSTGLPATNGDLFLKLDFAVADLAATLAVNQGRALKHLSFDPVTERLQMVLGDVVAGIQGGAGVTVTRRDGGLFVIQQTASLGGAVSVIEPEQARLEFVGLNSMLVMEPSSTNPSGFYGKFVLPSVLDAGINGLRLVLTLAGKTNASSGAGQLYFRFEHAVSPLGQAMTTAATVVPLVAVPLVSSGSYVALTPVRTPEAGVPAAGTPALFVPRSALVGGATVNFRLIRQMPAGAASPYAGAVGLLAAHWTLV